MLELLSAAYALHPAFGEAEIVEIGTGVRPAFPDNLPRIRWYGDTLYVNGLFRHGFLLAPAWRAGWPEFCWRSVIFQRCRMKILVNRRLA